MALHCENGEATCRLKDFKRNQAKAVPEMAQLVCNLLRRMSWSMVSKAELRSKETRSMEELWSTE